MYRIYDKMDSSCLDEFTGISSLLAKFLITRGISLKQYLKMIRISDIKSPFEFEDMSKVCERITRAINNKEKIVIYGDYDCDGICATSIMVIALRKLGASVGFFIPNRYIDGYGINEKRLLEINDKDYKLIITVDNGITQHATLKLAKELGIDVIISDHHQPMNVLPECFAIIHPQLSGFSDYNISGGFVAYQISRAILGYSDDYLLILAAITTISDIMPLIEENHNLVKLALSILNQKNNEYINLLYLNDFNSFFDSYKFASPIASKINAVGRIEKDLSVNRVVDFLISKDLEEIIKYNELILKSNTKRKDLVNFYYEKIVEKYEDNGLPIDIIFIEDIPEGIIGLIATRMVVKYNKAMIILTSEYENNDIYKGSARSYGNISIIELFNNNSSLLEKYGGHHKSGGLSISKNNFEEFKRSVFNYYHDFKLELKEEIVIELDIDEINFDSVKQYLELQPFGEGNPGGLFMIRNIHKSIFKLDRSGKHLLGNIGVCKLLGFNLSSYINNKNYVDIIFDFNISIYNNKEQIELRIKDLIASEKAVTL